MYNSMLWFFLIGAVLPIIIFLLSKKFPENKILKKVSLYTRTSLRKGKLSTP